MWRWMKRWRDWAGRNLWPPRRLHPGEACLRHGYERGGLTLYDHPVPWSAETVLVEASLRLTGTVGRRREDFTLHLTGAPPQSADQVRRDDGADGHRVIFRLPPPGRTTRAEVYYRHQPLGAIPLPYLGPADLLNQLRLEAPTLFARLGTESIACRALVAGQCRALTASALLVSPAGLLPLIDLGLSVEFRCGRTGWVGRSPVHLTPSQCQATSALVSVVAPRRPWRRGRWTVRWLAGEGLLAWQQLHIVSRAQFTRSLRLADTAFVVQSGGGPAYLTRQLPGPCVSRAGPCFFVESSEPGMAGLCRFQVTALVPGALRAPLLLEQDVLLGDGPTAVLPGTVDAAELLQLTAFELSVPGRTLGTLPLRPVPAAGLTGEGGFTPPVDFVWSAAAEEEIKERLSRLMEGPAPE